jgi:hypothetical protein
VRWNCAFTLVFAGNYTEAVFLKTLLESAGIAVSFDDVLLGERGREDYCLYVRSPDAERAQELVEDFRRNGRRTV